MFLESDVFRKRNHRGSLFSPASGVHCASMGIYGKRNGVDIFAWTPCFLDLALTSGVVGDDERMVIALENWSILIDIH